MTHTERAVVVLEDGSVYSGGAYGARGRALGEIVFSTGMTGYQETFTDPSYHGQIIVMTAPHIGNTGVNAEDAESRRYWARGVVIRDPARRASNWRSNGELEDALAEQGVVGVRDVDTRALTRHLRQAGVMRAGVFSGSALPSGAAEGGAAAREALADIVRGSAGMVGANLSGDVTTPERYTIEPDGPAVATVVAVDLGIKSRTPERLAERGARVVDLLRLVLDAGYPFFGICFGNQILGRALGYGTYKLDYGHRGINQPVLDRATGRIEITAHNHGFAVDAPVEGTSVAPFDGGRYGRVRVSHVGLNDGVVEGLACLDIPAFSVQYHPEAAAGPHDASYLFDRFMSLMRDGALHGSEVG